jgi:hypothetical protein
VNYSTYSALNENGTIPQKEGSLLARLVQESFFPTTVPVPRAPADTSSTFVNNMTLPVHRWFRYSAGFSAAWVSSVISSFRPNSTRIFDPFAGSATTLIAAEQAGVESWGIDAHPFICRVARAKLAWRTDPDAYLRKIRHIRDAAVNLTPEIEGYSTLIRACYSDDSLAQLDQLRQAYMLIQDESPALELAWLTLIGILRKVSKAGTAPWQYVLPKKQKSKPQDALTAFDEYSCMIYHDMRLGQLTVGPHAHFAWGDARTCDDVPRDFATLVITSPPYPNNYDYADATRLEMTFMREIQGWGELQDKVRKYLVRSCSQHVPEKAVNLDAVLAAQELAPIRDELTAVCRELTEVRETKGGKKNYHLMVACYFRDLAQVWIALRAACASPSKVCFVIGDSAPYGIYVPTIPWLGKLALAAGFASLVFEKTRDRNIKWKNRKHRVPLQEGRLWVEG